MKRFRYSRTKFLSNGKRYITHTTKFNMRNYLKRKKEARRKKYLDNWYDTHDAFGKPRGYRMSDIMKFK